MSSASEFNRKMREAERKLRQEAARVDRANRQAISNFNRQQVARARKIDDHNRRVIEQHNRQVDAVNKHNETAFNTVNRQLNAARQPRNVSFTVEERQLVDRVQEAAVERDDREYDVFLSYARLDGVEVAQALLQALQERGVAVWFDEAAIRPGKSMALQMDGGLRKARAGVALLTPVYLTGRFWTERELGALLHKDTLIPVLHGVSFADVAEYSGILPDLAGFTTDRDDVETIADKIAEAVREPEVA